MEGGTLQAIYMAILVIKCPSTMPFKSKAQRRKFAQLLVERKISDRTF
jgi:hypothetical protein